MVERNEAVGLPAAEVRLQADHRVASLTRKSSCCVRKKRREPLSNERPPEELDRVLVLILGQFIGHLVKIGGEFRLLESAARYIRMRRDHVTPRRQASRGLALRWCGRPFALLAAGLLCIPLPEQILLQRPNRGDLLGGTE